MDPEAIAPTIAMIFFGLFFGSLLLLGILYLLDCFLEWRDFKKKKLGNNNGTT